MFAFREDRNLELLTQGVAPKHPTPVYGQAPYYPTNPSTSGKACSELNPYVGPYYLAAMPSRGIPIKVTISTIGWDIEVIFIRSIS
jgi:hypothetical protein